MRGRTNLLGFNEDFINAYIDQYEVKSGNTVTAGDFVELFPQSDVMGICSSEGITIAGCLEYSNHIILLIRNMDNYGDGYTYKSADAFYILRKTNNGIEFVSNISISNALEGITKDDNYIYTYDRNNIYVYEFDSVNEEINLIGSVAFQMGNINLMNTLGNGILLFAQGNLVVTSSTGYVYQHMYVEKITVSGGSVTKQEIYHFQGTQNHADYKPNKLYIKTDVAISPDKSKILLLVYKSVGSSAQQYLVRVDYIEAFSFNSQNETVTDLGEISTTNIGTYGQFSCTFINNRFAIYFENNSFNSSSSSTDNNRLRINVIDFENLIILGTSYKFNDIALYTNANRIGLHSVVPLLVKNGNLIVLVKGYHFINITVNNELELEVQDNQYTPDFEYEESSTSQAPYKLINRFLNAVVVTNNNKYYIIFPVGYSDYSYIYSLLPMLVYFNELDVSNLPYIEMTSDKPKRVASYSGKINGVAKTSGNAGELIDVYVPY